MQLVEQRRADDVCTTLAIKSNPPSLSFARERRAVSDDRTTTSLLGRAWWLQYSIDGDAKLFGVVEELSMVWQPSMVGSRFNVPLDEKITATCLSTKTLFKMEGLATVSGLFFMNQMHIKLDSQIVPIDMSANELWGITHVTMELVGRPKGSSRYRGKGRNYASIAPSLAFGSASHCVRQRCFTAPFTSSRTTHQAFRSLLRASRIWISLFLVCPWAFVYCQRTSQWPC